MLNFLLHSCWLSLVLKLIRLFFLLGFFFKTHGFKILVCYNLACLFLDILEDLFSSSSITFQSSSLPPTMIVWHLRDALPPLHCTLLYFIWLNCTLMRCRAVDCNALHCTAVHYTALHCTAPDWTTLHYTALHCFQCSIQNCTAPLPHI